MEDLQVKIVFECDKYHVADELRKLANAIEETDEELTQWEAPHSVAEIDYGA
jgi:hypothetical protein